MIKIAVYVAFLGLMFNLASKIHNDTFTQKNLAGIIFGTLFFSGLLYYLSSRKIIDYDDVKFVLYVVDHKRQFETAIPLERIDEILLSAVGIRKAHDSYIIVFRDFHNQTQKVRLFPIPFTDDIEVLIVDTKYKNPQVIIRKCGIR